MSEFNIADVISQQVGEKVSKLDTARKVEEIPIGLIENNVKNFYSVPYDDDLRDSIECNGLLEPLLVVQDGDHYRLISGHRRMKALRELNEMDQTRWSAASCIVLPDMTDEEETVSVIEANRQRIKGAYELSEEAKRLTDAYTEMKKSGKQLPGKIRDRVAEAMKLSAAHVARLTAIREHLKLSGFIEKFKSGELPESVAYEISKMSYEEQCRLLDYTIDHGCGLSLPIVRKVDILCTVFKRCRHLNSGNDLCPNADEMYSVFYRNGMLEKCAGCCEQCIGRATCPHVCKYCKPETENDTQPRPHVSASSTADAYTALARKYPELDFSAMRETFCGRLRELRVKSGKTREEFSSSVGLYKATYSAYENASLPGIDTLPRIARALDVTTDYLLGLSDNPEGGNVVRWRPLDMEHWPKDGQLVLLSYENSIGGHGYQIARCVGPFSDELPFDNPNGNTSMVDYTDFDRWMPVEEEKR